MQEVKTIIIDKVKDIIESKEVKQEGGKDE